ncbi:hypothetical protein [Acetobacter sp. DsW_059]|uniref:hypothetical protein n=1 Tax=Acetobacter sp. DsW_059 TaxID=1670661 RepID=UPI001302872C|nr:hypothetical protein [Acetobacter sp. DsW_059]
MPDKDRYSNFLSALTDLCNQHGVGITENAVLFLMEREDYDSVYRLTEQGSLTT